MFSFTVYYSYYINIISLSFMYIISMFLKIMGVLSTIQLRVWGFCPRVFCPWGFCPRGVLSKGSFVRTRRKGHVIHTRIHKRCSSLNQHLYFRNVVNSPLYRCGEVESSQHFFFDCRFYREIRERLLNNVSQYTAANLT